MTNLTDHLTAAPRLWLDYNAYAGRLIANGKVPWGDVGDLVGFYRKAQGLLQSDVIALPFGAIAADQVQTRPAFHDAMASARRAIGPLKFLLADAALRSHLHEILVAMAASFGGTPIVLALPSPRVAVGWARELAGLVDVTDIGDDDYDNAALLLADFLRSVGDTAVAGVLLVESAANPPTSVDDLDLYRPLLNIAAHYRWSIGTQSDHALPALDGIDFAIASDATDGAISGLIVDRAFWSDGSARRCATDQFLHIAIPADAQPETVLARLSTLR